MCWNLKPAPKGKNSVSKKILAARGIVAAMAIGIAVLISSLGMPLLAGLASVFPAIFLTSMIALWLAQGPSVPLGAAGPMMMGGASVLFRSKKLKAPLGKRGFVYHESEDSEVISS